MKTYQGNGGSRYELEAILNKHILTTWAPLRLEVLNDDELGFLFLVLMKSSRGTSLWPAIDQELSEVESRLSAYANIESEQK